jgi:DNA ligase (NAD+)
MLDLQALVSRFKEASDAYYNGDPIMSDEDFDLLRDQIEAIDPKHAVLKQVGAKSNSVWPKVKHTVPMGSLLKVTTAEEFASWYQNYCPSQLVLLSEKLDGFSVSLRYVNGVFAQAVTRGSGSEGDDISPNVRKMKGFVPVIGLPGEVFVRCEAVLHIADWKQHFPDKKNPRNACAGAARRLDGEGCEHISLYALDLIGGTDTSKYDKLSFLAGQNFLLPYFELCPTVADMLKTYEKYKKIRPNLPYEIDGLVVEDNNCAEFARLGSVDGRPRAARAFKFPSESVPAVLKGVEWQVGRTGVLSPVAELEPTNIQGITVSRVYLDNIVQIREIGLKIGCVAKLTRRNDVIPKLDGLISTSPTDVEITIPEACPCCNSPTRFDEVRVYCTNDDCDAKSVARIMRFLKALNVKGFGEKTIEELCESGGVEDASDLLALTEEGLSHFVGEKTAKKLMTELRKKTQEVSIMDFVACLGIEGFASKTELLLDKYPTLEAMMTAKVEDLAEIPGIGASTALQIVRGFQARAELITHLRTHMSVTYPQKIAGGKFSGVAVCFTGYRDAAAESQIIVGGGKIASGVSKNTTHLVCLDVNSNSSKAQKARQLGIPIWTPEELQRFLQS